MKMYPYFDNSDLSIILTALAKYKKSLKIEIENGYMNYYRERDFERVSQLYTEIHKLLLT